MNKKVRLLNLTSVLFCILFIVFHQVGFGQSKSDESAPAQIITFDMVTKIADKKIPFDRPFILQINNFDAKSFKNALAYKVFHSNGKRTVYAECWNAAIECPNKHKYGWAPDISPETEINDGKLYLYFRGLKPNINFDVLLISQITDDHINDLLTLLESAINIRNNDSSEALKISKDLLKDLYDKDSPFPKNIGPAPFSSLAGFCNVMKNDMCDMFEIASRNLNITAVGAIPITILTSTMNQGTINNVTLKDLQLLQSNHDGDYFSSVSLGLRQITASILTPETGTYELNGRIKNLSASQGFLNSLRDSLNRLYALTINSTVNACIDYLIKHITDLSKNLTVLKALKKDYISYFESKRIFERMWLVGSTESEDLKTKGGSLLSTELGTTTIFIRDNHDKQRYIPRLFIGVDIFFRPVDRNVIRKRLLNPGKIKYEGVGFTGTAYDEISSKSTIFQNLSLSLGFTLGKIDQADFENLYNNMSLTIGPSYRFCRAFRLSSGLALMKRLNPNPLFSDKSVDTGIYGSFSVDFDFIQTIRSVTDLIFK